MGKIENFLIELNKEPTVYIAGERFSGFIKFRAKEKVKINKVIMKVIGSARVRWTQSAGKTTDEIKASQNFIDFTANFLNKTSNDDDLYLNIGDYSYPFEFNLPQNLPTSFEHKYGQIKYSLKGIIDISKGFDKHTSKHFSVISHLDLNKIPNLIQSFGATDQLMVGCGPCRSGPIKANFFIQKAGFVPGERIIFNATVENQSNNEIRMSVRLVQKMLFHAEADVLRIKKTLQKTRQVAFKNFPLTIRPRSTEKWDDSTLVIPPVCQSSDGRCSIIEIGYELIFNIDAYSNSRDLSLPIIIGTIPLESQRDKQNNASLENTKIDQIEYTFRPCVFGENSLDLDDDNIFETKEDNFIPLYPYYLIDFQNFK